MNLQLEEATTTALHEGIMGCIVAAIYAHGQPNSGDFDRIIDTLAGRELFLDTDIIKLLKGQIALRYMLDEEEFLQLSCDKITEDWKRSIFTIACHLILDTCPSTKSIRFLKALREGLGLSNVKDIMDVLRLLHKDRYDARLYNI